MFRKSFVVFATIAVFLLAAVSAYAAVDNVRCVVWQGDPTKFHTAISGESVRLKGVITTTDTSQIWYRWVYGDGTESSVSTLSGNTKYNVSIDKAYTGAEETPFTAILQVDGTDNSMANAVSDTFLVKIQSDSLDARINISIDNGLWYLYSNNSSSSYFHSFDSSPFLAWANSSYYASPTASTIQAFAINNHKINGDTSEDPYVECVQLGMNWLIQGYYSNSSYPMLQAVAIGIQTGGDPDANGNGYGIEVRDRSYRPAYQGGQIMDAIIASGVSPADDTGRDFTGRGSTWTYGELIQDMSDMYAYGQYDGVTNFADYSTDPSTPGQSGIIGGWRYSWNQWPDNSACQWGSIGMTPAQDAPWNCIVPDWVKTLNNNWLNYSHYQWNTVWGGFGYTSPSYGNALTPSGMVQLSFVGASTADPRWVKSERWHADNWDAWRNSYVMYAYYAFAKAMRLAEPMPVETFSSNGFNWYRGSETAMGLAERLVTQQNSAGYWTGYWTSSALATAWGVIILKPALFKAAPIACFDANPNPCYPNVPIMFDPTCSDHSETGKDIGDLVLFEWDWDDDGIYDDATTAPSEVNHAFSCSSLPCVYPVTLRVTDDEGLTATASRNIEVSNPPHPPVADAGGPYMVSTCAGDSLTLDGSASFDPNEGVHETGCTNCPDDTITAWDWDIDGAPFNYTSVSGEAAVISDTTGLTPGVIDIGLRVTDNTDAAFPGSGESDLTDEDFSSMEIYQGCICDLAARAKLDKIQLTWSHTGAASYDIYRSETGPNGSFELIADDHVTTYATYLDTGLTTGTTYYYRIVTSDGCGSKAASATPSLRTRRR